MNDYHVACGASAIYLGRLNKEGTQWTEKTDCTDEVLRAAADYLFALADKSATGQYVRSCRVGDGKTLHLICEVTGNREEDHASQ